MNANGGTPDPFGNTIGGVPIVHIIPGDACQTAIVEETNGVTGQTYRELVLLHQESGTQFSIRFNDRERARQIGRALIKDTPKDQRGVVSPTPLRDSLQAFIEKDDERVKK